MDKGHLNSFCLFAYFILSTIQGIFYALWHIFITKEIRIHFLENKRKFLIINPDEERFKSPRQFHIILNFHYLLCDFF